jgi:hypothetical protein
MREPGALILTCRTAHYDAFAAADQLAHSARIRIDPVSAADAVSYLAARCGPTADWQSLLDHLRTYPAGVLARGLSTPWRLSLVATVYRNSGDPSELLAHPTVAALDEHLLARFIPAATTLHRNDRNYQSDDVHRWLVHLGSHMAAPGASGGAPPSTPAGTDLLIHHLWRLAGERTVRVVDALATTMTVLLVAAPVWVLSSSPDPVGWACVVAAAAGLFAGRKDVRPPRRLHLRALRTLSGLRNAAVKFGAEVDRQMDRTLTVARGFVGATLPWVALIYTSAAILVSGLRVGETPSWIPEFFQPESLAANFRDSEPEWDHSLAIRIGYMLFGGLFFSMFAWALIAFCVACFLAALISMISGLTVGITDEPSVAARPAEIIRADLAVGLAVGLTPGILGPIGWAVFGPALALTIGAGTGRRYLAFLICSRMTKKLPLRLIAFLNWACTAGLLRMSGTAYQFRHREIQHWLATHPTG